MEAYQSSNWIKYTLGHQWQLEMGSTGRLVDRQVIKCKYLWEVPLDLDVTWRMSTRKWAKGQTNLPFYRGGMPGSCQQWSTTTELPITRVNANGGPGVHHLHGSRVWLVIGWRSKAGSAVAIATMYCICNSLGGLDSGGTADMATVNRV